MKTTRTIVHPDGHTDVETYMRDADGVWIWAVTKCNGGTMELKDARECDVNGTQVIICDVLEAGAVLPHSILLDEYLNPTWEKDADSVFGFLKAAEATELQDVPTIEDVTVNGYAFNSDRAKIENDMRQKLADEYNKLFAR